jgi:ATP-dependent DNA helicase RecQ
MAYDENFVLKITPSGKDILFGRKTVELTVLQPLVKMEERAEKKGSRKVSVNPQEELFGLLKQVRLRFAAQEDVPAYIIFSDAVLQEMVKEKPITAEEMIQISGIGEHKMWKYGQAFLDTISNYLDGSNSKKTKADTYRDTLELLKAGLSPAQAAEKRGLHETTIYSHIAYLYVNNKIGSIASLVSDEEVRLVKQAIDITGESKALKPAFDYLQQQVPYHKIRLAMAVLERNNLNATKP